ncbi:hypothetical protein MMC08_001963 [Hypocenomyce scalaris]|nr:hypothetical protein [Hypocenomyce scalaris]
MQFAIVALAAAAFAGLASAITVPGGSNPSGNPLTLPSAGELVPAGSPFIITWTPTTTGTVTLLLLQGPSTDVIPIAYIAQNINNTGTYAWTPSTSLTPDTTHYGIELVVDETQAYQYTSQFGISNPSYSSSSSASSTSTSASTFTSPTSTSATAKIQSSNGQTEVPATTTSTRHGSSSGSAVSSPNATTYHAPPAVTTSPSSAGSGAVSNKTSILSGTETVIVPATLQTKAIGTAGTISTAAASPATSTGAAGHMVTAGGVLAGVGAMVALLL